MTITTGSTIAQRNMKRVQCSSTSCPKRRAHHERPDVERGPQWFHVPYDHEGPWYCSIECKVYGTKELGENRATTKEAELSQVK